MRKNERVINIRKRLEHGLERGVAYMDSSAAFSSTTDTHRKKKGEEIKEGREGSPGAPDRARSRSG